MHKKTKWNPVLYTCRNVAPTMHVHTEKQCGTPFSCIASNRCNTYRNVAPNINIYAQKQSGTQFCITSTELHAEMWHPQCIYIPQNNVEPSLHVSLVIDADRSADFHTEWLKGCRFMQGCASWDFVDTAAYLGGQIPHNLCFWDEDRHF